MVQELFGKEKLVKSKVEPTQIQIKLKIKILNVAGMLLEIIAF